MLLDSLISNRRLVQTQIVCKQLAGVHLTVTSWGEGRPVVLLKSSVFTYINIKVRSSYNSFKATASPPAGGVGEASEWFQMWRFPSVLSLQTCNVSRVCSSIIMYWGHSGRALEAEQVGMMKRLPLLCLQPISRCVVACRGGLKVQVVFLPVLETILSSFAACLLVISMKRQPNRCW